MLEPGDIFLPQNETSISEASCFRLRKNTTEEDVDTVTLGYNASARKLENVLMVRLATLNSSKSDSRQVLLRLQACERCTVHLEITDDVKMVERITF